MVKYSLIFSITVWFTRDKWSSLKLSNSYLCLLQCVYNPISCDKDPHLCDQHSCLVWLWSICCVTKAVTTPTSAQEATTRCTQAGLRHGRIVQHAVRPQPEEVRANWYQITSGVQSTFIPDISSGHIYTRYQFRADIAWTLKIKTYVCPGLWSSGHIYAR